MCVGPWFTQGYVGVENSPFVILFFILASKFNVSLAINLSAWLNGSSLLLCAFFFNFMTTGTTFKGFCAGLVVFFKLVSLYTEGISVRISVKSVFTVCLLQRCASCEFWSRQPLQCWT